MLRLEKYSELTFFYICLLFIICLCWLHLHFCYLNKSIFTTVVNIKVLIFKRLYCLKIAYFWSLTFQTCVQPDIGTCTYSHSHFWVLHERITHATEFYSSQAVLSGPVSLWKYKKASTWMKVSQFASWWA